MHNHGADLQHNPLHSRENGSRQRLSGRTSFVVRSVPHSKPPHLLGGSPFKSAPGFSPALTLHHGDTMRPKFSGEPTPATLSPLSQLHYYIIVFAVCRSSIRTVSAAATRLRLWDLGMAEAEVECFGRRERGDERRGAGCAGNRSAGLAVNSGPPAP